LATRREGERPKPIRLSPRQWAIVMTIAELGNIYDSWVPLRVIQDSLCDIADTKCRRGIAESARRLRLRGLLEADGKGRGLRYRLAPQMLALLGQISNRNGLTFRRSRSTKPVDAPWGTTLRIYKMILESRVGMYTREIERRLGISRTTVRYHINKLKRLGLVEEPFPGYVKPAPPDMRRVEEALEAAGELRVFLEAVGLIYANGRVWLRPFTTKEYAMVKKEGSLRKAQRELKQLRNRAIIIRLPGRRCRFGVYIINPIYPVQIPLHVHDKSTKHLYGGSRVWRRRRNSSSCRSCVRVRRGMLGDGGGCGGSC
jgi:DNA-binding transcriptional ArsR family regulator